MANDASHIRNVAFIGVNHSGKTSLVESILYMTGAISRRGKIQDGTMATDYEPEAIARQMSTQVTMARTTYRDYTFNLMDCPGFVDFNEEVKLALMGVDAAVFVVEPDPARVIQMDTLLRFTEEIGVARLVFVNKLDKPDVNVSETLNALKQMPGTKVPRPLATMHYPFGTGSNFNGYVDVLKKEAFNYDSKGKPEHAEIPEHLKADLEAAREKLIESLADTDDALLEQVLEGKDISIDLLEKDLHGAVSGGTFVPILVGSAQHDLGIITLLDTLIGLCPSPVARQYKDKEGKLLTIRDDGPVVAQVMKTYIHPQAGKLSLARVITGTITADSQLVDSSRQGGKERVGGLYWLLGKKQEAMPTAGPGSIVAIARLETPHTGDTLVSEKESTILNAPPVPPPLYSLAIAPKNRNDEAKLSTLLAKLVEEDSVLKVDRDPDTHEYCLYGQGEVHLTLCRQRLERKYNIQLEAQKPKIAYKETITGKVESHGRHKKQTGGRGQFGEVYFKIEPLERGLGNKFSESIVGGAVPRQYIPGVEKGVMEALGRGPLAGFPVVDVHVNLFDGSYHDVDSDEMSFRMAAILGMRDGLAKAHPIILEPIANLTVVVPSTYTSGVLSQLNGRRGQILGYGPSQGRPGWDEVNAHAPQAELWDYIIDLRTLTHGLGYYTWQFAHLSPVPPTVSQALIAQATSHSQA